ncbi:MAG: DUF4197 domain-containing protein [Chitinophagales bacterium]|nr:DUF4197 domain-containing protein [Chitinophagales bacterium]MDW8427369.1 DUF4197 domain-containing protein [Chitinophagales bacterium]
MQTQRVTLYGLVVLFCLYCSDAVTSSAPSVPDVERDEPAQALKQVLEFASREAVKKLSAPDGYLKNQAIKILMPAEAKEVEQTLRQLGFSKLVDDAILSMNRAAEQAAAQALPVFTEAIKKMTLQDVQSIVLGGSDAATQFFKKATYAQLKARYTPIVDQALKKSHATKYWKDVFSRYNKIPGVKKVNPNLTDHVVTKALDGFFYQLSLEEKKIRQNPEATANEVIQKLFGK